MSPNVLNPPYKPLPDTALALTIWLGYVNLNASVAVAGSPAVATLTLPVGTNPGAFAALTAADVGDIVWIFALSGSPAVMTVYWTTIVEVTNATTAILATGQEVSGAQAVIYRPLTEAINNASNYILQDSITFEASITTRPTLDFTIFSADRSIIPNPTTGATTLTSVVNMVGMPVLMTDSQLDGSVLAYSLASPGINYKVGDLIEVYQSGVGYACVIMVDTVNGSGAITASHIVITGATGIPGGFMYTPANGLITIGGSGTGATVNVLTVSGPAFGAMPGDVFGGSIEQARATNYEGTNAIRIECQCVSWDAILNRRVLGITVGFPVSSTTLDYNGGQVSMGWSPAYGTQYYFVLSNPPPAAIISMTINGVTQTVGPFSALPPVGTGGFDWYWAFGGFYIYEDPSGPVLNDSDAIIITIQSVTPATPSLTYQNETPDEICEALIGFIQDSEGLTLANVVSEISASVPLPTVNAITFLANQTVDEALASLMTYINDGSTNFWYYIDPRRGFHFEILGQTTTAPWNLITSDGSDANAQAQVSALGTREKFADAAWINSQNLLPAITQVCIGNGSSKTFSVTYPVGAVPTIVFCDHNPMAGPLPPAPYTYDMVTYPKPQVVLELGSPGTCDWYWDPGSNQITQFGGNVAMSNTEEIYVTYQPDIGTIQPYPNPTTIPDAAMIARQAVEGGSGEYDLAVDLTDQLPFVQGAPAASAVQTIAQLLAQYFEKMAQQADLTTYRPGLAPGQSIEVEI